MHSFNKKSLSQKAADSIAERIIQKEFLIGEHLIEKKLARELVTNNFLLPALMIAHLYKSRWQVELFFKWIKEHLRIKAFTALPKTPLKLKYGLPSLFTCLSPSSANGFT